MDTYIENRWMVLPNHTNNLGTVHGGNVMKWVNGLGANAGLVGELPFRPERWRTNNRRSRSAFPTSGPVDEWPVREETSAPRGHA